jgi:hypothetical protein
MRISRQSSPNKYYETSKEYENMEYFIYFGKMMLSDPI